MPRKAIITLICLSPIAVHARDGVSSTNVDATPEFVFEGNVDFVDPVLREEIGPPRVLSGTMQTSRVSNPFHAKNEDGSTSEVYLPSESMVDQAEFTLDRNYVISYEAANNEMIGFIDVTDGKSNEEDDRVYISISFFNSNRLRNGYQIENLIIDLWDDSGEMVDAEEHLLYAPAYQKATFELVFINLETGEEAKATGEITMFSNLEHDVTPEEDYEQLEAQVRELDEKLQAQEQFISNLRAKLNLKDLDIAQRDQQLAELLAQNAELGTEIEQLRNGETIQVMEKANAALLDKLEESQEAREFSAATVAQMTVRQEFLAQDNANLADANAKLRQELASALSDLSEMRNQQEMLARQASKSFQTTLPPLSAADTRASQQKRLPVADTEAKASRQATDTPPPNLPEPSASMLDMAMAAMQPQDVTSADSATPAASTDEPAAHMTEPESPVQWRFPLPTVATVQTKTAPPHRAAASEEPEEEEEDSNRLIRRGPRH